MKYITSLIALFSAATLALPAYSATQTLQADSEPAPKTQHANGEMRMPNIAATAYLVQDLQSGQILVAKNLDSKIEPSSLTKLMTAYVVFDALKSGKIKPEQKLTVSEKAWKAEGARMFLERGKSVKVSELIMGLVVQSGNDAAITLAEGLSGNEAEFVALMNKTATQLGMKNTTFDNVTGLSSQAHLSTVRDMAILAAAIIRDFPDFYKIYSEKLFTYNGITQMSRNLLLFRDPSVDGFIGGQSQSAGHSLVASSHRNGRRVLSVVVGASSAEARATESSKLLNLALENFETPKMYTANQEVAHIKLYKGMRNSVPIGFEYDAYITIPKDSQNVKPILETQEPILAPVKKGQAVGTLKLMHGDQVLSEQNVVVLQDVAEANVFVRMWDSVILWFKIMFAD